MSANIRFCLSTILHGLLIILAIVISILLYANERVTNDKGVEKIEMAMSAAKAGSWYWDIRRDELVWDQRMFDLYGIREKDFDPHIKGFEACIHPDDRAAVLASVQSCIKSRSAYRAVFRIVDMDGRSRFIFAAGRVSPDGRFMAGICMASTRTDTLIPIPDDKAGAEVKTLSKPISMNTEPKQSPTP